MSLINAIKKILMGSNNEEKAEWLRKEFIPAYRRLIDAQMGRCRVRRALNTVNHLLTCSETKMHWAPTRLYCTLLEMKVAIEAGRHGDNVNLVLLEKSEALLDDYLIANRETKLAPA